MSIQERRELMVADYSLTPPGGEVIPAYTKELVALWALDHSPRPLRQVLSRDLCRAVAGDVAPDQINFARFMRAFRAQVNRPSQPEVIIASDRGASRVFWYALAEDVQVQWPEGANFGPDRPKIRFELGKGHWLYGLEKLEEKILAASRHQARDLEGFMRNVLGRSVLPGERRKFIEEVLEVNDTRLAVSAFSLEPVRFRQHRQPHLHIEGFRLRRETNQNKKERKSLPSGLSEKVETDRHVVERAVRAARNMVVEMSTRDYPRWTCLVDGLIDPQSLELGQKADPLSINPDEFISWCQFGLEEVYKLQKEIATNPSSVRMSKWTHDYQQIVDTVPIVLRRFSSLLKKPMGIPGRFRKKIESSRKRYREIQASTYNGPSIDISVFINGRPQPSF